MYAVQVVFHRKAARQKKQLHIGTWLMYALHNRSHPVIVTELHVSGWHRPLRLASTIPALL